MCNLCRCLKVLSKVSSLCLTSQVDISNVSDSYRIWSQFDSGEGSAATDSSAADTADTFMFHDPRVPLFADRIITAQDNLGNQDVWCAGSREIWLIQVFLALSLISHLSSALGFRHTFWFHFEFALFTSSGNNSWWMLRSGFYRTLTMAV